MKKTLKKLELKKIYCAYLVTGGDDDNTVDKSKIKRTTRNELSNDNCNGDNQGG